MTRKSRRVTKDGMDALRSELLAEIRKTREEIYRTVGYDQQIAGCRERTLLIASNRLAHLGA